MIPRAARAYAPGVRFPVLARWLVLCGAGVACVLADHVQNDTWWQLRAGQEIWHGHLPLTDTWSYTAAGRHWPDHEWLWQAAFYALYRLGRLPLVSAVNLFLAMAALVLARPAGVVRRADAYLLALAVPLISLSWSVRPQTTSLLLAVVVLRLVVAERWWPILPLMLVWANLHGAVAYGVVLLAAACVAAWWDGRRGRRLAVVGATAVAGLLLTLATPLGTGLWSYVALEPLRPGPPGGIAEWAPPLRANPASAAFWAWTLLVVVSVALTRARRPHRLLGWPTRVELVASVATFGLALLAIRNIPVFAAASLCLLIRLWRPDAPDTEAPARLAPVALGAAGLASLAFVAAVWSSPPASLGWHPISPGAVQAIEACPGRVYTGYNGAGILLWWAPSVPVFVDSRQDPYPQSVLTYAGLRHGDGHDAVFQRYGVRCAALTQADGDAVAVLRSEGWTTTWTDGRWAVLASPGASHAG